MKETGKVHHLFGEPFRLFVVRDTKRGNRQSYLVHKPYASSITYRKSNLRAEGKVYRLKTETRINLCAIPGDIKYMDYA